MGFMTELIEQMKKIWSGFLPWQKVTVVGVSILALVSIVYFILLGQDPLMEPLYTNLDPKDASAIVANLNEQNVTYRLTDEGRTILVPSGEKYQLRLDMAGKVNLDGIVGFETFNETRFGETDTDKRVRFLVALQGELTRTVEELDEVESAKVHIALPQPSLFIREQNSPTASVLLRLKPYAQLKPEQVSSILSFVSHSVEGLKPQNVSIMDVNGDLLSEGLAESGSVAVSRMSANQLALQQQYENELSRSIQTMLERMLGNGSVVVRASVSMDFDQVETISEKYGDSVLISEQTKEENSTGITTGSGANPADANMGSSTYGSIGSGTNNEYQFSESQRNYEVDKTVETTVRAPGKVIKLSLSVIVDKELTNEEKVSIQEAVGMAAGIDLGRGDQVSVVGMAFNTEQNDRMLEELAKAEEDAKQREYLGYGLSALGIILILGVAIFGIRRLAKIVPRTTISSAYGEGAAAVEEPLNWQKGLSQEAQDKKQIRAQVEKLVDTNPEDVANVLKTWLVEE